MTYTLSAKNERPIQEGMVFNITVSFNDLVLSSGKKIALLLSDTVLVKADGQEQFTKADKGLSDVSDNLVA